MPHENRCTVSGRTTASRELHRRIKQLEEELRAHDIDEGYEWPAPDDDHSVARAESADKS